MNLKKVKIVCRDAPGWGGGADASDITQACPHTPFRAALFFSRAPIGVDRTSLAALVQSGCTANETPADAAVSIDTTAYACRLHLGVYGFRRDTLRRFVSLAPSPLEQLEQLEQMRAVEAGIPIVVGELASVLGGGVDTEEDLQVAQAALVARRTAALRYESGSAK